VADELVLLDDKGPILPESVSSVSTKITKRFADVDVILGPRNAADAARPRRRGDRIAGGRRKPLSVGLSVSLVWWRTSSAGMAAAWLFTTKAAAQSPQAQAPSVPCSRLTRCGRSNRRSSNSEASSFAIDVQDNTARARSSPKTPERLRPRSSCSMRQQLHAKVACPPNTMDLNDGLFLSPGEVVHLALHNHNAAGRYSWGLLRSSLSPIPMLKVPEITVSSIAGCQCAGTLKSAGSLIRKVL